MLKIRYIDSAQALQAACATCSQYSLLAIDTEFERTHTYFAKPALFQLYDTDTVYLLDPVSITDLRAFSDLLHHGQANIIMHAASEDLSLLEHVTGTPLTRLFDTQIAAGFCGLESSLGYHSLVNNILNIEVSKTLTRSNWLQRPLSPAQLNYAALDVYYLPTLYAWLCERLEALGRVDWLHEEMNLFIRHVGVDEVERDYLKLIKNLPDKAAVRSRLVHLCEWRDHLARQRNVPRRQLLDDSLLLTLATQPPRDTAALDKLRERHRASRRAQRDDLDAVLEHLSAAPLRDLPPAAQNLANYRSIISEMQGIVRNCAKDLNLPPALLASKRMLENYITHVHILKLEDLPTEFCGWRRNFLAEPLLECLRHA